MAGNCDFDVPDNHLQAAVVPILRQFGGDVLMRGALSIFVWVLLLGVASPAIAGQAAQAQPGRVVDRIVARIEGDIILLSQVRELEAFQELVEGKAESDDGLLAELIEQWIVQTEATESRFPEPAQSEVDRKLARLVAQFPTAEAYKSKLSELGLSATQVRQMLVRQIYIERYIDYIFNESVPTEIYTLPHHYHLQI